jgi:hypothetical protein
MHTRYFGKHKEAAPHLEDEDLDEPAEDSSAADETCYEARSSTATFSCRA